MYKFKSKSDTLHFLKNKRFNINNFLSFKKLQILKNDLWVDLILKKFRNKSIIIRSSALDEDQKLKSNAGKYDSIKIIKLNKKNLIQNTKKVIKKFKSQNDKIIFQEFLKETDLSGVVFTREINNLAPYYIINYDLSGQTNLITSGKKNTSQKTLIIHRNFNNIPKKFFKLIKVCKKLEKILGIDYLDIEFAIKNNKVYVFQVRPIFKRNKISDKIINSILINIEKKIFKLQKKSPFVNGKSTIFSNMSDWNPAEMIGAKANNLSISLYEELITDHVWSKQRSDYGYKYVESDPLMVNFAFAPYIDLRVDLNSFLPKGLPVSIQNKTVNFLINKLKKKTYLHDKIEFNLISTCNSINLKKDLNKYLTRKEADLYKKLLIDLTNKIISGNNNPFKKDIQKIQDLKKKLNNKNKLNLHPIQNIFYLVEICKNYGTLAFSGIARTAFITTSILRDLKNSGILNEKKISNFYNCINSINYSFKSDFNKLISKKITKSYFLNKYGHLRPNTYSIVSNNYKEGFINYFGKNSKKRNLMSKKKKFKLSNKENYEINKTLKRMNLKINSRKLFSLAHQSIYYREYAKYIFSKVIDLIFENLKDFGKELKISREDLQFISIRTILNAYNNLSPLKLAEIMKLEIKQNKKLFNYSKAIKLPDVITSPKDIYFFAQDNLKENFITNLKTIGSVYFIRSSLKKIDIKKIQDKIVLIKNADPGYDFLFSHNIKGLITQYGGTNSHMAIRCMENNIPAAIGVGEKKFNFYSICKKIILDCQSKKIIKLY